MNEHYESELATRAHEAKLQAYYIAEDAERERMRPFYLLRPKVFPDGDQWCVLYGENIQEGVCAFGDTPAKAATQFDVEWLNGKAGIKMHNECITIDPPVWCHGCGRMLVAHGRLIRGDVSAMCAECSTEAGAP